ncbi:MAG: SagB/ThcOx family dehydrogenase [Desertimonas sp.]
MIGESIHGANLVDIVYGGDVPDTGDPAEDYIEASKLHRELIGWEAPGVQMMQRTPELYPIVARAGRRYASRPQLPMPPHPSADHSIEAALQARRSAFDFAPNPITFGELAGVLRLTYGVAPGTGDGTDLPPMRPTPSAGALYPLDLFVAARRVEGIDAGLYHADTAADALAGLHDIDLESLGAASMQPDMAHDAAAVIVVAASIWRSRVKYGPRALRFALMEAGHAVQNMLLIAESYGLAARTIGGFCDDEVNAVLGLQGVDEFAVSLVLVGPRG